MNFLANLINGISLGSVYAIIALGYTMVYGIAKMLNFAHGDVIMVGAYVAFTVISTMHLPIWAGVLLSILICTSNFHFLLEILREFCIAYFWF